MVWAAEAMLAVLYNAKWHDFRKEREDRMQYCILAYSPSKEKEIRIGALLGGQNWTGVCDVQVSAITPKALPWPLGAILIVMIMDYVIDDCVIGTLPAVISRENLYPQTQRQVGLWNCFNFSCYYAQLGTDCSSTGERIVHQPLYYFGVSICQLVLRTMRDDGISLIFFDSTIFSLRLSIPEWCFSDRMASQSHSVIENRCKIRMQSSFPDTWSQHAVQPSPRVNQPSADTCLIAKYHSQPQFKGLATLQGN